MVVRVNKTNNYTVMSNKHLRDKNLSLKAKGLLSVVLSLPDDWDYSVNGLASISKECETSIKSALNELKANGYLEVIKKMPNETESGRIEYEYDFYEFPRDHEKQEGKKQGIEILPVEFQGVENQPINKYIDKPNKEKIKKEVNKFIPPTIDEVISYCMERRNNVDAQKFIDYYTANGWRVGKNKMIDWRAAVRTWERNNYNNKGSYGSSNPFTELKRREGRI